MASLIPLPVEEGPGRKIVRVSQPLVHDICRCFKQSQLVGESGCLVQVRSRQTVHVEQVDNSVQDKHSLQSRQCPLLCQFDLPEPLGLSKELVAKAIRVPRLRPLWKGIQTLLAKAVMSIRVKRENGNR